MGFTTVHRRCDLLADGWSPRAITRGVRDGRLIRLRRDHYVLGTSRDDDIHRAVRVGGRLACVSLLAKLGVFVMNRDDLHVQIDRGDSRLRQPDDRSTPLSFRRQAARVRLHWVSGKKTDAAASVVDVAAAVAQAVRCQEPRAAVATIDSVLHLGLLDEAGLQDVFATLHPCFRSILKLADGSAESGSETFMRLVLRQLGLQFRTQVEIPGVGRVDFVVDGWLIIECDSKAHHEGWEKQRNDRRRDLAAAALGYATLRPLAEDIFWNRGAVIDAVRGLASLRRRRAMTR